MLQLEARLAQLEGERTNQQTSLKSSRRVQPLIHRLLPDDPFMTVVVVIVVLMVSTVIKHVFMLINTMLIARVSTNIARGTRLRIFERAMHMDRAGFAKYGTSGFTTQITATTEMLANGIMEVYGGAIREPLKILACLAGACFISWRLLVLSLIVAPVVTYLIVWLSKRIKSVSRRALEQAQSFQHVMLEAFGSIQTVQAYGMEKTEQRRFERTTQRHAAAVTQSSVLQCADEARDGVVGHRHGGHHGGHRGLPRALSRNASVRDSYYGQPLERLDDDGVLRAVDWRQRSGAQTVDGLHGCQFGHGRG